MASLPLVGGPAAAPTLNGSGAGTQAPRSALLLLALDEDLAARLGGLAVGLDGGVRHHAELAALGDQLPCRLGQVDLDVLRLPGRDREPGRADLQLPLLLRRRGGRL